MCYCTAESGSMHAGAVRGGAVEGVEECGVGPDLSCVIPAVRRWRHVALLRGVNGRNSTARTVTHLLASPGK